MRDDALICLGAIAGAFGVHGEVRLKSFTARPDDIAAYGALCTENGGRSFAVTLTGQTGNALVARLSGVDSKESADALRGTRLYAPRDRLPMLAGDEFYHADLVGLTVQDTGGTVLGRVTSVQNHGAADLLEVQPASGGGTFLVPFTRDTVPTVDLATGRIVADLPGGLI